MRMASRMNPWERFLHYEHQILSFENKRGWAIGRHTISGLLVLIAVGLWFAFIIPQWVSLNSLLTFAEIITGLLIAYVLLVFFMSGGFGRVVDVI